MNNNITATFDFDSSAIQCAGYDYRTLELALDLPTGLYTYAEVPPHVFEGLIKSDSKGRFFNKFIKKAYNFKK